VGQRGRSIPVSSCSLPRVTAIVECVTGPEIAEIIGPQIIKRCVLEREEGEHFGNFAIKTRRDILRLPCQVGLELDAMEPSPHKHGHLVF
jgi:hypothetical protein